VEEKISCPHCGKKITKISIFCGHCGAAVKDSGGSGGITVPAAPSKIVIKRESQFVCMAVSYKVLVNGRDYGNIGQGESIIASLTTDTALVEIHCTTVLMTNNKLTMKLRLENNPRINFKVQYGGQIIPTVLGARVLEKM
jgi:DNA-directed RNA polymerase subunit RPC12/RpoP